MLLHKLLATATLCGATLAAALVGSAADSALHLSESTPISLGNAIAVGATVAGMAWWLAGQFNKINVRLSALEQRLKMHKKEKDDE